MLRVSLLMAASLGTLTVAGAARKTLPPWLAAPGIVYAGLLAGRSRPVFGGPDVVQAAAAVGLLSLWMTAAVVWVFRRPQARLEA